jgi:uncharacterized membrane protein YtjA (UPF0391 family)
MDVMRVPAFVIASDVAAGNPIQQDPIVKLRRTKCDSGSCGVAGTADFPKRWSGGRDNWRPSLLFFLVSIVAGVLGFTGISAASADIARFLFYVFVVIFLVLLIQGLTIFRV